MTHQIFLSIRERFVTLLAEGQNSYKYVRHYREEINKYIEEDDEDDDAVILKQLLYMIMVIYTEKTKTRYHTNDDIAAKIEKDIFEDAIKILKEDKYKDQKIVEINEIITREIDETNFAAYEKRYGYRPSININAIIEITDENVEQVYTNFYSVKSILVPRNRLNDNDKYKEIEDYLFCLYYFNKTETQSVF
jgi:hypothetical protein